VEEAEARAHAALAARIRSLCERRSIVLTHLADRADVSQSHFFAVLRGESSPTLSVLVRIAGALGVSVAELLLPD
jgi:transcriptional regulator with XRE-family HTH domain